MPRKYALPIAAAALALLSVTVYSQLRPAAAPSAVTLPQATSFLIVLGVGDRTPAAWNGSVSLSGGQILDIQGWRFSGRDTTDRKSTWRASTRTLNAGSGPGAVAAENGVIVTASLTDAAPAFSVTTPAGPFSFTAQEVGYGAQKSFLKGRVLVDRVPVTAQLTSSPEEQDFPAIAQTAESIWAAYVEFVHGDRSEDVQGGFKTPPGSLDFLARPAGGDQVFLLQYSKAKRAWSDAVAVTAPHLDVMRTAVAVDGQGRVWVFWSAGRDGNFDLFARSYAGGKFSPALQLCDPGPDLNPVAATDAAGRVWVAWQGFRNGNLEVLAAAQNGDAFTPENTVSFSPASDWDPSIAAAPNGEIAVAWDTYDKGDYDVYFRRLKWESGGIRTGDPVAGAASTGFEARSSIAYDPQNRLWVAFEASDIQWGKDFGAYRTTGIALYQGHSLRVACFQGNDRFTTTASLAAMLPGPPAGRMFPGNLGPGKDPVFPDPGLAENRRPNGGARVPAMPLNSFPRLAVDPAGKVYLAFRTTTGNGRSGVGSIWHEEVAVFDGAAWSAPAIVPFTDGLLDIRPALAAIAPGQLLMVSTGDHRLSPLPVVGGDSVNTDLFAAELVVPGARQNLQLTPSRVEAAAGDPKAQDEADMIAAMRRFRTRAGDREFRLLRGEFHRHTEISADGGRDGPVVDAYRYFVDAASMDWAGCCDHDNGGGREYNWWIEQKLNDAYNLGERFVSMFAYERSVAYPEGHRNVVFAERGVRPLPRLPVSAPDSPAAPAPDTQMLYRYIRQFDGIVASHTSGTGMGTDWRDNDPVREPVVEIYQGDRQNYEMPGAPRSNSAGDSIGGWRPLGFVSLALEKGYRLGFQASSDHISTHISYCNLFVTEPTRRGLMEALKSRRVYGSTDNILADVKSGDHFMGEEFSTGDPPAISVNLWGAADFAVVHIIKDGQYAYSLHPPPGSVSFTWRDNAAVKGKTSYYYVRGEQVNGEVVWVSPMWIRYQ